VAGLEGLEINPHRTKMAIPPMNKAQAAIKTIANETTRALYFNKPALRAACSMPW
jgi:hypothetical protein